MMTTQLKYKKEITAWLNAHDISDYKILKNDQHGYVVDVYGDVHIGGKDLTHIPVQFGKIKGNFSCCVNELVSLKGSPFEVHHFNCNDNKLTSLEFCPQKVSGIFYASDNDIQSLEFFPQYIDSGVYLDKNKALEKILDSVEDCYGFESLYQVHLEYVIEQRKNELEKKTLLTPSKKSIGKT